MPQPPNSMNRGVPPGGNGPPGVPGPGGRMMPVGGGGPKEPWGSQMPPPNRGGGGWGEEPPSQSGGSGWGEIDPMKARDAAAGGWGGNGLDGGAPQWKQQRGGPLGGGPIRQSPNWDDHPQVSGPPQDECRFKVGFVQGYNFHDFQFPLSLCDNRDSTSNFKCVILSRLK